MRHQDITVGDTLRLKRDNAYGFGPIAVTVTELRTRGTYKVPHVIGTVDDAIVRHSLGDREAAFRPSDFSGVAGTLNLSDELGGF